MPTWKSLRGFEMQFPNKKDYLEDLEGYLDAVIIACITIHKEHINDSLMKVTGGEMTKEQQQQYWIGKQLFSDEPIYKLMRLINNYRDDKYLDEKDQIIFVIVQCIEEAESYLTSISKANHDEELRNMVVLMIQSNLPVKDIAIELCETGWYDIEKLDSLERSIHRWIKQYNIKSVT